MLIGIQKYVVVFPRLNRPYGKDGRDIVSTLFIGSSFFAKPLHAKVYRAKFMCLLRPLCLNLSQHNMAVAYDRGTCFNLLQNLS